jgi:hypothetical protein
MRQSPEAGRYRTARTAVDTQPHRLAARHRAQLRMRVEIVARLRRQQTCSPVGAALAVALRLGDEATAELAGIPDTPELQRRDMALLDDDGAVREGSATQMRGLVQAYRNGRPLDLFTASPTELLACCIARVGDDSLGASESSWPG